VRIESAIWSLDSEGQAAFLGPLLITRFPSSEVPACIVPSTVGASLNDSDVLAGAVRLTIEAPKKVSAEWQGRPPHGAGIWAFVTTSLRAATNARERALGASSVVAMHGGIDGGVVDRTAWAASNPCHESYESRGLSVATVRHGA
jgi:hypothetical protein